MPTLKKPTIYDVAQRAGVSITTVSRMLNTPDKLNPETREKVLRAIDALGFIPKAEARARAMQRAGRIGVISPFFTAPSFIQRLRGIAETLSPALASSSSTARISEARSSTVVDKQISASTIPRKGDKEASSSRSADLISAAVRIRKRTR